MGNRRQKASMCVMLLTLTLYHRNSFLSSITTAETVKKIDATLSWINDTEHIKTLEASTSISRTSISTTKNDTTRDDVFLLENLGRPKRVPCGSYKCFFRLKTNRQVGYLVAPEMKSDRIKSLKAGWELAKQLESDYNIQHFLLGPPTKQKVSPQLAKRLNRNLYHERYRIILKGKKANRFLEGSTALIQKVKLAPKQHLLIGCLDAKVRAFEQDWPNFLPHIKYKESFARNFNESLVEVKKILEMEPCLVKDMQVLLDSKGNFYHLDFDRCFSSSGRTSKWHMSKSFTKSCIKQLDKIGRHIQRALKPKKIE